MPQQWSSASPKGHERKYGTLPVPQNSARGNRLNWLPTRNMQNSILLPPPAPTLILGNGQLPIYVTAGPFAYWSVEILLLWLKCYVKTSLFYCSLRIEDKMGVVLPPPDKREIWGKEESKKRLLTALFTGFKEGWRPFFFKNQHGWWGEQ